MTRTFRSLHNRNFRLFYLGQFVSLSGTWMQTVAQGWLVFRLTRSGVALGTVTALQFLPMLLAGPWGGVIADRFDKRRLLICAQTAMALTAAALAAVVLTDVVQLWMVYLLALLGGFGNVVDMPARQAFVSEMVEPDELANAIGLNSALFNATRIVGPAFAAVLIAGTDIGWCFAINAVSFIAVIAGLVAMRPGELHRSVPVARGRGQVRAGVRYVWSTPVLRLTLLMVAVVGTFGLNFPVVLPLLADEFGQGATGYSLFTVATAAGSLVGALAAASRARPTPLVLSTAAGVFGVAMLAGAAAPSLVFEVAALVVVGAALITYLASANATVQLTSSPAMRGRVMALYGLVLLGSNPLGGPLMGWICEQLGARAGLAIGGAAGLVVAAVTGSALHRARVAQLDGPQAAVGAEAPGASAPAAAKAA